MPGGGWGNGGRDDRAHAQIGRMVRHVAGWYHAQVLVRRALPSVEQPLRTHRANLDSATRAGILAHRRVLVQPEQTTICSPASLLHLRCLIGNCRTAPLADRQHAKENLGTVSCCGRYVDFHNTKPAFVMLAGAEQMSELQDRRKYPRFEWQLVCGCRFAHSQNSILSAFLAPGDKNVSVQHYMSLSH